MPVIRAQVVLPFFTNIPSDVVTNTLYFDELVPATLPEAAVALTPLLDAFYSSIYSPSFLASYVNAATAHINYYRMDQPPPRVPETRDLTLTGVTETDSAFPTEMAAVLSFQGDRLGGTPQARRRGRIYVGGIGSAAITPGTPSSYPIFSSSFIVSITGAANVMVDDAVTAGFNWVVWSPTDQLATVITNGWVDNTPDTQRRRGVEATARTLWAAGP